MKCMNVMQCNSYRQKKKKTQKPKNKEQWSQREKTMKHKDHIRKSQLV